MCEHEMGIYVTGHYMQAIAYM